MACGEGESRGEAGACIGIAVRRVRALVGEGATVARERPEADLIGAGWEAGEAVGASANRCGSGDHRGIVRVSGNSIRSEARAIERDRDSTEAGFAAILLAIRIGITPDEISDGNGLIVACVDGIVCLACRHDEGGGETGACIRIAVRRIRALVGESAGGNLATNVSMMARDKKIQMPLYQVLVYPIANNDMNNESYVKYADAKPLNKPMMAWFVKNYLTTTAQSADPRISLVKANLAGLPKTLIIAAEIDPLQTEGKLLVEKLKAAGVETNYELYNGVTHEFFGMAAVVPQAKDAQMLVSKKIKTAFDM